MAAPVLSRYQQRMRADDVVIGDDDLLDLSEFDVGKAVPDHVGYLRLDRGVPLKSIHQKLATIGKKADVIITWTESVGVFFHAYIHDDVGHRMFEVTVHLERCQLVDYHVDEEFSILTSVDALIAMSTTGAKRHARMYVARTANKLQLVIDDLTSVPIEVEDWSDPQFGPDITNADMYTISRSTLMEFFSKSFRPTFVIEMQVHDQVISMECIIDTKAHVSIYSEDVYHDAMSEMVRGRDYACDDISKWLPSDLNPILIGVVSGKVGQFAMFSLGGGITINNTVNFHLIHGTEKNSYFLVSTEPLNEVGKVTTSFGALRVVTPEV